MEGLGLGGKERGIKGPPHWVDVVKVASVEKWGSLICWGNSEDSLDL